MGIGKENGAAPVIDFYFDFISPFSYLAHQRLPELAGRFGCALNYHVADLAMLKRLAANTAPRMVDMPLKLSYSRVDQKRWADRYGVPITPPPGSHDSSWLNRGNFYAADRNQTAGYVAAVWRRMRRDVAEENTWCRLRSWLQGKMDSRVRTPLRRQPASVVSLNSRSHEAQL